MYTVTGESSSRLIELKKYATTGSLSQQYFISTGATSGDGVDVSLTTTGVTASTFVYYIGGITYVDTFISGITEETVFTFESLAHEDENNFDDLPIIKDDKKENIVDKPEVDNNVFIIRQSQAVFEDQYRLKNIRNISELEFYAGGGHFNIVNNT